MDDNMFGIRLRELRRAKSMSQEELCKALNAIHSLELNKSLISRYESGTHLPKLSLIPKLSRFFGISTDYLLGAADRPESENIVLPFDLKRVPLAINLKADEPITGDEFEYTKNMLADFAIKVMDNSMIGVRIYPGDIAFIHAQSDAGNGEITLVSIDNEPASIKRVYKGHNQIILHSENLIIKDMEFTKADINRINILGKVLEVKFKL